MQIHASPETAQSPVIGGLEAAEIDGGQQEALANGRRSFLRRNQTIRQRSAQI